MASRKSRRSRDQCVLERGERRRASSVAKSAATFEGSGMPPTKKVVSTGARDAREPWSRSVSALSESQSRTFSSWAGPTMTLLAARRPGRNRSADAVAAGRSQTASRSGAAELASQQTEASGAGRAGSTKGVETPCDGAQGMTTDTNELMSASEATGLTPAAPAQAVVALIVGIAPEKLPSEITRAQCEQVVIGGDVGRPGRTNVVSGHGAMATGVR